MPDTVPQVDTPHTDPPRGQISLRTLLLALSVPGMPLLVTALLGYIAPAVAIIGALLLLQFPVYLLLRLATAPREVDDPFLRARLNR